MPKYVESEFYPYYLLAVNVSVVLEMEALCLRTLHDTDTPAMVGVRLCIKVFRTFSRAKTWWAANLFPKRTAF